MKRKHELRNHITEVEAIKGHARDLAVRQQYGIATNFKRIYLGDKKTSEEHLEQSLKCKNTGDMLHSIVHEAITQGRITTEQEQKTLTVATELMGRMQKYAAFSMTQFEASQKGNDSSIIEVIDGW